MPFHIIILISQNKTSMKIHGFCHIFHAGKSVLAKLRYPIFKMFLGGGAGKILAFFVKEGKALEELGPMAKLKVTSFNSETPALYKFKLRALLSIIFIV